MIREVIKAKIVNVISTDAAGRKAPLSIILITGFTKIMITTIGGIITIEMYLSAK
jgi:hypothetical protein